MRHRITAHPERRSPQFRTPVLITEKFCRPYVTQNPVKRRGWTLKSVGSHPMRDDVSNRVVSRAYKAAFDKVDRHLGIKRKPHPDA